MHAHENAAILLRIYKMTFSESEVPVAYSMVEVASQPCEPARSALDRFCYYWMAFNNIYVAVADRQNYRASLKTDANGVVITSQCGHVKIPKVNTIPERKQIILAVAVFSDALKRQLITHPNVRFFAYRTPRWQRQAIECDGNGQRLNGVLNMGHTVDVRYPVVSPLDTVSYEDYLGGRGTSLTRDELTKQIVNLLYTVRNNTFHGGKEPSEANDLEVIEAALPLLKMIVESFLQ